MLGQILKHAVPILFAILALRESRPALAADKPPETTNLTVSQMQAGGYVFDKGNRLVTDPRLKISFTPMFETFRSQAPLNCNVRIQWTGGGLIQGRILCDFYASERYVGSWKSDEVAANEETLVFPLTLPSSPLYNERDLYNLRIAFETEDRTIIMDQRDLPIESGWARNYVVGVVAPDGVTRITGFHSEKQAPQIADIFQLANFHDLTIHATQLVSNTSPILTRELPLDPMRFTAFDLVVVSPESLREIRPPQWQALTTWIRAGGRACLCATMPVPENLRAAWRELFNERPDSSRLTFSEKGIPEFTDGGTRLRVRAGCGRVICLTESVDVDSFEWREDVMWLYGVREKRRTEIHDSGAWSIGKIPPNDEKFRQTFHPLAPVKRPLADLRRPLNSPEIGTVSPVTIFLLLGTCLMLIGPVDYYVLGRLGMRKLTWVFLPVVALTTTWATMRVSQSALGAKDYARSVSIADLDSVGKVCRVSRIEQRYAGRQSIDHRTMTSSLRVDFERPLIGWNSNSNPLVPWGGDDLSKQPPLRYAGKITGNYEVLEPMFQWSPRLFRESTFGDDPRINSAPLQSINWPEIEDAFWSTKDGLKKVRELVRNVLPTAVVFVRIGGQTVPCDPNVEPKPEVKGSFALPESAGRALGSEGAERLVHIIGSATSCPLTYDEAGEEGLPAVKRPHGLFGLVRERSPTCGADLEDFQWIDSDDQTEAVLLILIEGEDSVIYRRRLAVNNRE